MNLHSQNKKNKIKKIEHIFKNVTDESKEKLVTKSLQNSNISSFNKSYL